MLPSFPDHCEGEGSKKRNNQGCSSVVRCVFDKYEALGSIPTMEWGRGEEGKGEKMREGK